MDRFEALCFDIDLRIRPLWEHIDEVAEWDLETVAAYLRAAYGKGYADAFRDGGSLFTDNGYSMPAAD